MTWIVVLSIIVVSALKLLITTMPTPVVKWFLGRFELHSKLTPSHVSIKKNGKILEGEEKDKFIANFNEATFLEKYYVHSGNQQHFLHPENTKNPYVIDAKRGKSNVKLSVYTYKDRVDVVKQYKKRIEAYSLLSDPLQQEAVS
ncbi:YfmQ family protein [Priestia sp. JV24]|uniref:YfmQ family protein n=1 Tax=Priestia TaxID=2800373 RepID=UPI0021D68B7A|nr:MULTISPECIES: YfmQ family protein [Priestia]MCU7711354.1 YfmQ family protein [Priestia megaterium]MCW1045935.1 YfmQ family protein [Priestia sp. JV24]